MRKLIPILALVMGHLASAQTQENTNSTVGFELDALPYITGGYYGSVWYGKNQMRYRAIITQVTTPEFVLEEGFTNNDIQSYTFITDYFFKPGFEAWWIGAGLEYWDAEIQTDAALETAKYENYVFTVGGGYVWKFHRNFYLNPWVAGHIRIAGDSEVMVDGVEFEPAAFTPELSLKIGWHF